MSTEQKNPKKMQMTLDEYKKVKEQYAKNKLKLQFPMLIKCVIGIPVAYLLFLFIYFLVYVRFAGDH